MHTQGEVASTHILGTGRGACYLCSTFQGGPVQNVTELGGLRPSPGCRTKRLRLFHHLWCGRCQ